MWLNMMSNKKFQELIDALIEKAIKRRLSTICSESVRDGEIIHCDEEILEQLLRKGHLSISKDDEDTLIDAGLGYFEGPEGCYLIHSMPEIFNGTPLDNHRSINLWISQMYFVEVKIDNRAYHLKLLSKKHLIDLLNDYKSRQSVNLPSVEELMEQEKTFWSWDFAIKKVNLFKDYSCRCYYCGEESAKTYCGMWECRSDYAYIADRVCYVYIVVDACEIIDLRFFPFQTLDLEPIEARCMLDKLLEEIELKKISKKDEF